MTQPRPVISNPARTLVRNLCAGASGGRPRIHEMALFHEAPLCKGGSAERWGIVISGGTKIPHQFENWIRDDRDAARSCHSEPVRTLAWESVFSDSGRFVNRPYKHDPGVFRERKDGLFFPPHPLHRTGKPQKRHV